MKFFKGTKKRVKTMPVPPRTAEEIAKEYAELIGKAGQAQYLVYVYSKELENLNSALLRVNSEQSRRLELDKQSQTPNKEATNE